MLKTVSPDGTPIDLHDSSRHFVGRYLDSCFSGEELLVTSKDLPERLLWSHSVTSRQEARTYLRGKIVAKFFVALCIALLIISSLKIPGELSLAMIVAILLWAVLSTEPDEGDKAHVTTCWLDFGKRTWNSRTDYTDGSLKLMPDTVPLDSMGIGYCFYPVEEDDITYYLALFGSFSDSYYYQTGMAVTSTDEKKIQNFAQSLASAWNIKYLGRTDLQYRRKA